MSFGQFIFPLSEVAVVTSYGDLPSVSTVPSGIGYYVSDLSYIATSAVDHWDFSKIPDRTWAEILSISPSKLAAGMTCCATDLGLRPFVWDGGEWVDQTDAQLRDDLAANDGTKLIGSCASIAELRTVSGTYDQQRIHVTSYYDTWAASLTSPVGGGYFRWISASTETDDGGSVIAVTGVGTGRWYREIGISVTPGEFGAIGDGVTDDTLFLNKMNYYAVHNSKTVDVTKQKTYITTGITLNDYTLAAAVSGDYQREHVPAFIGTSGKYSSAKFLASASTTGYVITGNNSAGVRVGGFKINGNGVAMGANLSWIGTASGGVAPSNGNEIFNIWCENFVGTGLSFNQCHDTDIHGIFTTGSGTSSTTAVSLVGGGGYMTIRDSVIYGGKLVMSCQNGEVRNTILNQVELTGSSFNVIGFRGCHFIGGDTYAVMSSATGNATYSLTFEDCYFPSNMTAGFIQGRFWRGATFKNCRFEMGGTGATGVLTSNIAAAAGTGQKPRFVFENCMFYCSSMTYDTTNADYKFVNCSYAAGSVTSIPQTFQDPASAVVTQVVGTTNSNLQTNDTMLQIGGWARLSGATNSKPPVAGSSTGQYGLIVGWNYSAGLGECNIGYYKGAGSQNSIYFGNYSTGAFVNTWRMVDDAFGPATDGGGTIGTAALRPSLIFAQTATVSTSDERLKTFLSVTDAEKQAAKQIKEIMSKFQFNDAIVKKGSDMARYHFGVGAQSVKKILEDNGLNPDMYAFFCYDAWEEVKNDNGDIITHAGNRFGIRYEELLCFLLTVL